MKKKFFNNYFKKIISFLFIFIIFGAFINTAIAQENYNFANESGLTSTGKNAGYSSTTPSPENIVGRAIQTVLGLLGIVFLALMIYAGIMWMTAQGNEQKVEKAKNMITEAIVGLIIVVISYAIAFFIIQYFSNNTLA